MLSNNARNPENSEPKAPNPPFCPSGAERWLKKEKGNPTRSSGSSSGGSSASDLKRRLQDLPSPNEAALLASRAINTSRRLSRKRDLYFYNETNRIDENDEKEEQESHQSRRGLESKNSDARTRRRAKFLPGGMQAQAIASQPTSANNSDEVLSVDETPRTDTQRHNSLSETPSTHSARCDQLPVINSSRSQKSPPLFRVSSSRASLCSAPSKFGGYRPNSGVILQNLSSGSEPSSDYENVTDRIGFPPNIELGSAPSYNRVSRIPTPRQVFNNLDSSRHSTASSYNRFSRMPTPPDVFSNLDSSRNLTASPGSKISLDESLSPINESPANEKDHGSSTMSFYRVKDTPRSDCCDKRNSTDKTADQRKFLSARESLSGYRSQTLEPLSSLGTRRDVSVERAPTEIRNYYEEDRYGDESLGSYQKVSSSKESLDNPSYSNFVMNADQPASLESVSSKPEFENLKTQYRENLGSPMTKSAFSGGLSDKGSVHSLESVASKPGFENLKTQYRENLGSPMIKSAFSGGLSDKGSVHSLESVASKQEFENLKTQYRENLGSSMTKEASSGGASAKGSAQSVESVSSRSGFENLKTQYQENLGSSTTKAAFSGGASAKGSVQSVESVSSRSGFENSKTQYQESRDSQLSKALSKCFLDPSEVKATRIPMSTTKVHERTERLSSPGFRDGSSERNSAISAILKFHNKDSKKMEEDVLGRESTRSRDSHEYVNVPSLALNSQDVSSSSSSLKKTASRKHVNADDLIEALSNVSLLQTENTYRLSPRTYSGKSETADALKKSMKFDENYERCTSSRSRGTKPAESSTFRERDRLDPVSTESDRQAYSKNFLASDSESDLRSDKESSARNLENNETSNSSRAVDLEKDAASKSIKRDAADSVYKNYEKSRDSSSPLPRTNETLKSKPPADEEDLDEDSEDSESPRSEDKPINRYATSPKCYETLESLSKDLEDSDNFLTKLKSVESTFPVSYQVSYLQPSYEGEVSDKLTERSRLNLLDNQIGDGQDAFVKDSTKFEPSDSSEDEDQQDKVIDGKVRVSLEKMAAEQFRRNIYAEQARAIQSDNLSFFTEKLYGTPFSVTESASTSKLRYSHDSPRFRKKSQDRFPFTMSEKPSVASHKHPGRLDSLNEESKSPERTYKLELHPSITRLAGKGFVETPAEIIDYVSFSEDRPSRSGMKGLMKKFSARLKKPKKPDGEAVAKTTDVLYKNRDYRGDSVVDSCSESSLLKELKVCNSTSGNPSTAKESPDDKSSVVTEKSLIKNESSKDTLPSVNSYRRRDRDNLWVQEIKSPDQNRIEQVQITETPKKTEDKSKKDPYSVFFVKNSQQTPVASARGALPEEEPKSEISTGKRNKVKFRGSGLAVMPKASDENVPRSSIKRRNFENRKEAGCLCLRFYRMIVPAVRYRSRKSKSSGSLSAKRRPGFSPGKRKG